MMGSIVETPVGGVLIEVHSPRRYGLHQGNWDILHPSRPPTHTDNEFVCGDGDPEVGIGITHNLGPLETDKCKGLLLGASV